MTTKPGDSSGLSSLRGAAARKTSTTATKKGTPDVPATRKRAKSTTRSSGRRRRPVAADSAATRQAIIDGATSAFGMHGYEGTSLQAIGEHAGLTAATLYHYFPGKAAIFQAVGDEVGRELRRRNDLAIEGASSSRAQIAGVLRSLGEWIIERPEIALFIATYAAEVAMNHEVRRLSPTERWTEPIEYYASMARGGIERGELGPDLEPEVVAGLVQGLVYGMSALAAVGRSFGSTDRVIDAFVRAIEGTLFIDSA